MKVSKDREDIGKTRESKKGFFRLLLRTDGCIGFSLRSASATSVEAEPWQELHNVEGIESIDWGCHPQKGVDT